MIWAVQCESRVQLPVCEVNSKLRIQLREAAFEITPLVSWWQVLLQSQRSLITAREAVQNSEALTISKGTPECGCTAPRPTAVHLQGNKWASGPLHASLSPFRALLASAPWPHTIWNYLVAHPAHTHWCPTPGVFETTFPVLLPISPLHLGI